MTSIPASTRQQLRYPDHYRARMAVAKARRNGTLVPGPCEMASGDCKGGIEAHHDDYSKPLNVRWLCRRHHYQVDRPKLERLYAGRCGCGAEWSLRGGDKVCRPCTARRSRDYRKRLRESLAEQAARRLEQTFQVDSGALRAAVR